MAAYKENANDNFLLRYFKAIRFYLLTGLMVWVPLIVTVWLTWWLFTNVGLGIESVIERGYDKLSDFGEEHERVKFLTTLEYEKGYGFLTTVALFLTTGFFARNIVGQKLIKSAERLLSRIPGFSRIYKAVRQIRDVVVGRDGAVFQKVCIIEYPRKGVHVVGFITSEEEGIIQTATKKKLSAVFVPTTPNPTSGFLLYLPPDEIVTIDIPVEEAMKLIVSGGAYIPGKHDDEEPPHRIWTRRKSDKAGAKKAGKRRKNERREQRN